MRYRLQIKESIHHPYVIGNRSYPYPTFRWKDIAVSDDLEALKKCMTMKDDRYRIIDTHNQDMCVW